MKKKLLREILDFTKRQQQALSEEDIERFDRVTRRQHEFVEEYEYKFYNDNKIYLLEPYFTITDETYYTIEEIREHEKNEYVLNNIFKPRILNKMHHFPENEDEILFLFNRYKVEYESYPIKTDLTGEVKLHKLKYIFTLI